MLDASRKAIAACRGSTRESLAQNELLVLALTRLIEIVGEAAKNVSEETRGRYPGVPWRAIAGTRDRLIHGYFDVELDHLWIIVSHDLPQLVVDLQGTESL